MDDNKIVDPYEELRELILKLSNLSKELNLNGEIIINPSSNVAIYDGKPNLIDLSDEIKLVKESADDYRSLAIKSFSKTEYTVANVLLNKSARLTLSQVIKKYGIIIEKSISLQETANLIWGESFEKSNNLIESCRLIDLGSTNVEDIFINQLKALSNIENVVRRELYYTKLF